MTTHKVNHENELVIYQFTDETLNLLYQYTKVLINTNTSLDFSFYPHLQYITFRCGYNQITDLTKNTNLVMVDFGSDYNQPLYLPANLKVLVLGEAFNQSMSELPLNLEQLIMNVNSYEHQIIMPNSVTEVCLYGNFMNYITVLGYPEHQDFEKYWPANVQIVGKDILRFHAAIWPAMLLGLGLDLPRTLYVHGFILDEQGKKMSKSLGNVITPKEVLAKYSADVFRYYLMRYIPSYDDGNFSFKKMEEVYNNELANELGNAVRRTEAMITKYQDNVIGNIPISEHDMTAFFRAIEDCRFDRALDEVWERVRALNQYIDEMKPWDIAKKKDTAHLQEVLAYQVGSLLDIATLLEPFMPRTSVAIKHIFADGIVHPSEGTLFPKHDTPESKSA